MAERDTAEQRVTNATLLLEIRHLGEKIEQHIADEKERSGDHEGRLRKLEESNTTNRTLLGLWNAANTGGLLFSFLRLVVK